jgi:outer membrane protein assembly factor BamB
MPRFAAAQAREDATQPTTTVATTIPTTLPGRGLAEHPMLYIGEWCKKLFVINDGRIIWTFAAPGKSEFEDAWMLSNGNILFTRLTYIAEVTPEKQIVWRFDAPGKTEIATCQPIGLDKVFFIENGRPPKLIVMNIKTGQTEVEHELPYDPKQSVHSQFRRARVTAAGTYLIAFQLMNQVVEYDAHFNEIWKYPIRSPWAVVRLRNGNTLITDERDVQILEVNKAGQTVWKLTPADLPPDQRFTYAQTCTRAPSGNTIVCTHVARGNPPQLIEVTPDKKVVWMLRDWPTLGGSTALQLLDDPAIPESPGESQH